MKVLEERIEDVTVASGGTVEGFVDGFAKSTGLTTCYDTQVFGDVTAVEVVLQRDNACQ